MDMLVCQVRPRSSRLVALLSVDLSMRILDILYRDRPVQVPEADGVPRRAEESHRQGVQKFVLREREWSGRERLINCKRH